MVHTCTAKQKLTAEKSGAPIGAPFFSTLAAAAAVVVAAATQVVAVAIAAAAEQEHQNDDPPAAVATPETITVTHNRYLQIRILLRPSPYIPCYSGGQKR